ncbi:MAG: ribosome recycling factor [Buchnera aphidicola (Periphyllus acericola)]|uniref:ribosome recycling factor n=1 Tax=Buchnera aphidicola TaxID=9 RepID=UPI0030CCC384|nr:ribosome recycling factor [Buchnera aphidicola (Periphyllus acericola)]
MNQIQQETEKKMKSCIKNFLASINKLRTDRASPDLLKDLSIEYYGKKTFLGNVSNITVEDSHTLKINTFDKNINKDVEKSIIRSNLGLNPISHGDIIRVPIPLLTEERRNDLIKILYKQAENSKICIRMIRKDSNKLINVSLKDKNISKNEKNKYKNEIQVLTDMYILEIDRLKKIKENSLFSL